jgi:trimeric autotransporter adhesin
MTLNTVTLTWDFTDLIQSGESATLVIEPTTQLTDVTDGFIEVEVPRPVTFTGGTGQLAGIVPNDSTNVAPQGAGYTVTVTTAAGQVIYSQTVVINYANGATQKLSSLSPAAPSPQLAGFLEGSYPGGGGGEAEWLDGDGQWTAPTAAQVGADTSGAAAAAQTAAETQAAADVATETTRAEGAESTNATAVSAETSRAEGVEAGKASTTALTSETSRAEGAEGTNASAIATETSRAETAETGKVTGATPAASANFQPANPAGTNSATLVMMGLGSAVTYTPAGSGKVIITVTGNTQGSVAAGTVIGARYADSASTAAPANGAAVPSGATRFGSGSSDQSIRISGSAGGSGFAFTDRLTLTPGHTYWFDLALDTTTGTVTVDNLSFTIAEQIA